MARWLRRRIQEVANGFRTSKSGTLESFIGRLAQNSCRLFWRVGLFKQPWVKLLKNNESQKSALYSVLKIERLHGQGCIPIGVLLLDRAGDRLFARIREDLADVADEEALEVVGGLMDDIVVRVRDQGAVQVFDWFSTTLSNYLQMDGPHVILILSDNWKDAIDRLYDDNVSRQDEISSKRSGLVSGS